MRQRTGNRGDAREDVRSESCRAAGPEARHFGLWWADPVAALLIAGVVVKEGRESWRSEGCFVVSGRSCCFFFRFELDFQPGGGEVLLRMRGPEGTRQLISEAFLASSP